MSDIRELDFWEKPTPYRLLVGGNRTLIFRPVGIIEQTTISMTELATTTKKFTQEVQKLVEVFAESNH